MLRVLIAALALPVTELAASADELPCGVLEEGHSGSIAEWPNDPVDFDCARGFRELTLCILNREGIDWLPNAGPDFAAIYDGDSVYALTREHHPAYPMIVRRQVVQDSVGKVSVKTTACGYGDKAASDELIASYKQLDGQIFENANRDPKQ